MTTEEAYQIVAKQFKAMETTMEKVRDAHPEWYGQEWIYEMDLNEKHYANAVSITSEAFADLVVEPAIEGIANLYTFLYNCGCDAFSIYYEEDLKTRFQLIEQTEQSFTISYVELFDIIADGGTHYMTYIKDGDNWKLKETEFRNVEKEPLNFTADDFPDMTFVEMAKVNGEEFIVLKDKDYYEVCNVKTSEVNLDLAESY